MPPPNGTAWEPGLRTIGLLGGIGSGKSTAAGLLAESLSGPDSLLDADQEVGLLLGSPALAEEVAAQLGTGLLRPDGLLDRRAVAARVFADDAERRQLEEILHPEVRRAFHRRLQALEGTGRPIWAILDIPLLLERGLADICDFLIFVELSDAERGRRSTERHGWSEAEWRSREAAQADLARKRSASDAILDNAGGYPALKAQVQELLPRLHALPPRPLSQRWPRWDQAPLP